MWWGTGGEQGGRWAMRIPRGVGMPHTARKLLSLQEPYVPTRLRAIATAEISWSAPRRTCPAASQREVPRSGPTGSASCCARRRLVG